MKIIRLACGHGPGEIWRLIFFLFFFFGGGQMVLHARTGMGKDLSAAPLARLSGTNF
jgi:hypothetical protein